jgi:hypothetical protein
MGARHLLVIAGAVALGLSACKKEFVEGDTIQVVDTVSATNATTVSFSYGWGGSLVIRPEGVAIGINDTLGGVRIPLDLQSGDRLIATLQVGLSQTDADLPCVDSLHVSIGAVLGSGFEVTPNGSGVVSFDGAFTVDSLWQQNVWVKQFTRQQELTVSGNRTTPVVQTFARLRSMNNGCTADTVWIINRSLTLTVIHP